jgi:ABC-type lipoprotein release transport system permease subunit
MAGDLIYDGAQRLALSRAQVSFRFAAGMLVPGVLVIVAARATCLPARYAARLDPVAGLRAE